jgi:hypothetical protein
MLTLACLVVAVSAEATTLVGVQWNVPVPARDIGDRQLGVDAGVTLTQMKNAYVGVGADLIDHYWPASSAYAATFDRYLRTERMEALEGSDWAMSAFQITTHLKLVAPVWERCEPWMRIGAGVYRLNLNLDERRPEGTFAWVEGLSNIRTVGGGYGAIGFDVRVSSPLVLGADAAFHYLRTREKSTWGWGGITDLPDFTAVTVGVHAAFGRK